MVTVMSRKQEKLLQQLVNLAGDSDLVIRAFRELNAESGPPDLMEVAQRIYDIRTNSKNSP